MSEQKPQMTTGQAAQPQMVTTPSEQFPGAASPTVPDADDAEEESSASDIVKALRDIFPRLERIERELGIKPRSRPSERAIRRSPELPRPGIEPMTAED